MVTHVDQGFKSLPWHRQRENGRCARLEDRYRQCVLGDALYDRDNFGGLCRFSSVSTVLGIILECIMKIHSFGPKKKIGVSKVAQW